MEIVVRPPAPFQDGEAVAFETLPVIPNVPVVWPRGGGFFVTFPIAAGDHVLLIFSERSFAEWRATGAIGDAADTRAHSLSYPFAIPGVAPDASPIADKVAGRMVLGKDGNEAQISIAAGEVKIGKTATDFVALASKVDGELNNVDLACRRFVWYPLHARRGWFHRGEVQMSILAQTDDGDLDLSTGNLVVVTDPDVETAIRLTNRFRSNKGEWFLDQRIGVDYFGRILGVKNPDLLSIQRYLTKIVLACPGVVEVESLDVSLDNASRELTATIKARTQSGALVSGQLGQPFVVEP